MSLFPKHCSSHYHHHMLLALSSLISASVHSHLERDSERKLLGGEGGHVGECVMKCSWDTEKCVKPTLFQNRSHISAQFSWGLAIKQIGVWCRETVLLKSLSWKMAAGNDSRENSLSTLNCSSLSLWNHNDFRCTLLWLEPSVIPSSFWSAIDFYCSLLLLFFFSPIHSGAFAAGFNNYLAFASSCHRTMHWLESRRTLLKLVTESIVRYHFDIYKDLTAL